VIAASSAPAPAVKVRFPTQSIRPGLRVPVSRRLRYDQMVPTTPIGTLTQNTARQSTVDSSPPASSPRNWPASAVIWLMPRAIPRCRAGKASVRIAAELAVSMDPPKACTIRKPISHSAPEPPVSGSSESASEAQEKIAKPMLYIRTRPNMSPSRPRVTTSTAETSW
jgi:hypothetical protein